MISQDRELSRRFASSPVKKIWFDRAYLEFKQCETPSDSCSSVVLHGRALDDGSESVSRSRCNCSGLCETRSSSTMLSAWLVEVNSHSSLPVLVEVVVRYLVVVLDGLDMPLAHCVAYRMWFC